MVLYKLHPSVLNTKLFVYVKSSLLVPDTMTNSVLDISICYWTNFDPHCVLIISLVEFKTV